MIKNSGKEAVIFISVVIGIFMLGLDGISLKTKTEGKSWLCCR